MQEAFNTIQPNTAPIASFYAISDPEHNWITLDHLSAQHCEAHPGEDTDLYATANPIKAVLMETGTSAAVMAVESMPCPKNRDTQVDDGSSILYSRSQSTMTRSQSTMSRSEGTISESCIMDTEPAIGASDLLDSRMQKDDIVDQGVRTYIALNRCTLQFSM